LNYKVVVDELALLKPEFTKLTQKSRIHWHNDIEQKGAEIRELFLADSAAPFVDLSKERTLPANG
jgi:hypothetical protein